MWTPKWTHAVPVLAWMIANAVVFPTGAMALIMVYRKQMADYYEAEQARRQSRNVEHGTPDDGV